MKPSRLLAIASCLGLACAATMTGAQAASSAALDGKKGQDVESSAVRPGDQAFVDTSAATLWAEPASTRPIDAPSTSNPVDLDRWNSNMEETEKRGWLTGRTETQALYGTEVRVTDVRGGWAKVVIPEQKTPQDPRGYPGWVPSVQLSRSPAFEHAQEGRGRAMVTAKRASLTVPAGGDHGRIPLSFNTELPVVSQSSATVQVALPTGGTGTLAAGDVAVYGPGQEPPTPTGEQIVQSGKRFLGLRYLWGGISSFGYDCSGFVYAMYKAHGIDIARDADAQAVQGKAVAEKDLQPGDLLFFAQPGGSGAVHHVGMYIGSGKMIHAPNESASVTITDWKAWDAHGEYSGARRYI